MEADLTRKDIIYIRKGGRVFKLNVTLRKSKKVSFECEQEQEKNTV